MQDWPLWAPCVCVCVVGARTSRLPTTLQHVLRDTARVIKISFVKKNPLLRQILQPRSLGSCSEVRGRSGFSFPFLFFFLGGQAPDSRSRRWGPRPPPPPTLRPRPGRRWSCVAARCPQGAEHSDGFQMSLTGR